MLCNPDAETAAKAAGADYVGLDEYIEKIKGGWTDVDVIITQPAIMGKIGAPRPYPRSPRPDAQPQERHCDQRRGQGCRRGKEG